jgi:S-DNA-T family DNA segregation ATPase FtsK/SpoIIIE
VSNIRGEVPFALRVMDWRDSNIVLGEQMNARGYDSCRLLAAHKGVGILRPDGDIQADGQVGADAVAVTVRTFYMPNEDWQTICRRGRSLRLAAGTLTGHATGDDPAPVFDHSAVEVIGTATVPERAAVEMPEPLASIVEYLEEIGDDAPEFVSNADLAAVLDVDPTWLGRRLAELGCRSIRERLTDESGQSRQVRGHLTADLLDAAATWNDDSTDDDL